jgi:hypothetical protein
MAEELIQVLAAYTQEGLVFPVDTRLRPRGEEGELVVTPSQLQAYFSSEAQPWEALTYTKLRFVAGDLDVARSVEATLETLFHRFAGDSNFAEDVRKMRRRLELASAPERSIRSAPGRFTMAIFFLASCWFQRACTPRPARCETVFGVALAPARLKSMMPARSITLPSFAARSNMSCVWLPAQNAMASLCRTSTQAVERLTSQILRREFPEGLERELTRTFETVRVIYERVVR